MKNKDVETLESVELQPFEVKQAIAGLGIEETDQHLLSYLDFLASMLPVKAAYFLHVVPSLNLFHALFTKEVNALAGGYLLNDNIRREMGKNIFRYLSRDRDVEVEYDVREGDALEELLKDSKEIKADLVIIGQKDEAETHGILARNLARKTTANALIIPEKAKHSLKKILVPVDFSPYSIKALQTALAINKQLKEPAEITCINVYQMPEFSSYKVGMAIDQFQHMIEADRMNAFKAFVHTYAPGEDIKTVLLKKDMPRTPAYLMDYATDNEVDFLIMGAKGHSRVALLLMGSVTEKLLSINDSIPTLLIR